MRLLRLCLLLAVVLLISLLSQLLLENYLEDDTWDGFSSWAQFDSSHLFKEVTVPVVLWWAPLEGMTGASPGAVKQCGQHSCFFTYGRSFLHHSLTKALMFYGSNINFTDLPLPRNSSSPVWALLHEESPRNVAPLSHQLAISLFNYTATFSRLSSFPLTTQYLTSLHTLTDLKYFVRTEEKTRLQREMGLAPVMYMQSDCSTMTDRDSYVLELSKHIQVDSYGTCLHNKDLPPHLRPPHSLDTILGDDLLHLVAKYKFILALENGVCFDYITEKLWRPLISGSVPIYFGSPSVSDWLPYNKSALLCVDYKSPKHLADHLHQLNQNDIEYNSYLSHKLNSTLTNSWLIQTVANRKWGTEWETEKPNFVEAFDCFICEKAYSQKVSVASTHHYSCPMPVSILSGKPNSSNFWLDSWFYGQCEAEVIRKFVDSGLSNFTQQEYKVALNKLMLKNKCHYTKKNAKTIRSND